MEKMTRKTINTLMKNIKVLKHDNQKDEKFKQVYFFKHKKDYENGVYLPYIISSYGRVFSIRYHMQKDVVHEISPALNKDNYLHLILYENGKKYACRVNRLVAIAFVKNNSYKIKTDVDHKDGDTLNNCVWNLRWCTPIQNAKYTWDNNRGYIGYGEKSNSSKYSNKDIRKVCKLLEKDYSYHDIEKETGVSYHTIFNILHKRQWSTISDDYDFSQNTYLLHKNRKR